MPDEAGNSSLAGRYSGLARGGQAWFRTGLLAQARLFKIICRAKNKCPKKVDEVGYIE